MVSPEKAIELLKNERECVNTSTCDRDCKNCTLAGEQHEISDAIAMGIAAIRFVVYMKSSAELVLL